MATYSGLINGGLDKATSIAVDNEGNVYVTGYSDGIGTFLDYATIKYNINGVIQWVSRYNGLSPITPNDLPNSIAIDQSGNVYVTGSSNGLNNRSDITTIKYNSNGVEQWVQGYDSPIDGTDVGNSLVLDKEGNIYVTGFIQAIPNFSISDYATIKYSNDGIQLWAVHYNGPDGLYDNAYGIALDTYGNVYVTGQSYGVTTEFDYATVKYNPNGEQLWVARYNGPANLGDNAASISVDAYGNVYVTGSSTGIGTLTDFATVKYNSDGIEQWVQRYNGQGNQYDGANSIALDGDANVYVTGSSGLGTGDDYDYATIKYNTSGEELWIKYYNGPGNGEDRAKLLVVDHASNVYVTGFSFGNNYDYATIKYSQDPVPVELTSFLATLQSHNVILIWTTATELNNFGFEIERSTNKTDWRIIGFKEGNGTTTETHNYSFVDNLYEINFQKIYYRLKQINYDGSFEYLNAIEVDIPPSEFDLFQNYPNPFNPNTVISWQVPVGSWQTLKVYDLLGREVATLVNEYKSAGNHSVEFNDAGLPSGVYLYKMQTTNFSTSRKMILIK